MVLSDELLERFKARDEKIRKQEAKAEAKKKALA